MADNSAAFIGKVSGLMGAQSATVNLHRESRWEEMSALELEYDDEDVRGESTHDDLIMDVRCGCISIANHMR